MTPKSPARSELHPPTAKLQQSASVGFLGSATLQVWEIAKLAESTFRAQAGKLSHPSAKVSEKLRVKVWRKGLGQSVTVQRSSSP
jgi:hypothetical protein